ncbi:PIN domain-containing protein [Dethiobacter alkaliphilus]|uniref:PilT protein domain protein n=1 Tax=Dethiobacter alkaliphilus AHT 1 TaxID=555088 RepID=C0GD89_DETAL|nr:type II toxin-antitoxin system VapC family toxin [Dethiobacter alkaliphilus]EEG78610.1 PilT protein domain protein [Dethiobacter alkaliphilus AHT 1]
MLHPCFLNGGWLDTNVVLRFLVRDNEEMFSKASSLFARAERGEILLLLHPITVAEIIWTLESFYGYDKSQIVCVLRSFIEADGIHVPEKEIIATSLTFYLDKNVDYVDAYLFAYASQSGSPTIYTFDKKHFMRLGIREEESLL